MSPINGTGTLPVNQPRDLIEQTAALERSLNETVTNPEFALTRDPDTALFVVLVRDRGTGYLLDQLPAEDIVKRGVDVGLNVIL